MAESVTGQLLIASPSMGDWFHRSVILVVEHSDEGAFGLVLNRPTETTVGEAAPELAELIGDEHVIHVGGPVAPNAVTAVGDHPDPADSSKLVVGTVGMVDLESPTDVSRLRVYSGYAGWGPSSSTASSRRRRGSWRRRIPTIHSARATCGRGCSTARAESSRCWRGSQRTRRSTSQDS